MEGFPNFATNRGRRLPGRYVTRERYPLYLVGERHSPWLLDQRGAGHQVAGQVFEVDAQVLAAMDVLERVSAPDGYRRVALEVQPAAGGAALTVQAYLKPPEQFAQAEARLGPLAEYTLEHAALYRPRT
ncbi:gamma-glutamylcyclotransferase [Ramlibacter sp. G-1-2-2]|uniref:Gamma-glutamylcyclotransferase family protein n=1 Tax=Ramlibacter agri TaxID=2728837 RepID=A0A848H9U3_9BURK|nr:gamma-glutamylcyclotransferase family protein [Ramlibacter agri]NML45253.1 gamma-glutamylcyclotransferase [Ramlibacter agri]